MRHDIILRALQQSYGGSRYLVKVLAKHIDANWHLYGKSKRDLTNVIWNWFPGGNTAASTADKIMDDLGNNAG